MLACATCRFPFHRATLTRCRCYPCSLGYSDVISDGFYDVFGDFPEVVEATSVFPGPIDALQKVRTVPGDVREVREPFTGNAMRARLE